MDDDDYEMMSVLQLIKNACIEVSENENKHDIIILGYNKSCL